MKIHESISHPFKEKSYHITLENKDNIYAFELAECIKEQLPQTKVVITSSQKKSDKKYEIKLIIVNLLK